MKTTQARKRGECERVIVDNANTTMAQTTIARGQSAMDYLPRARVRALTRSSRGDTRETETVPRTCWKRFSHDDEDAFPRVTLPGRARFVRRQRRLCEQGSACCRCAVKGYTLVEPSPANFAARLDEYNQSTNGGTLNSSKFTPEQNRNNYSVQ